MIERRSTYDPAPMLTNAALAFVAILLIFVCAIIAAQIIKTGQANTESWAALTGLIGWVTGVVGTIFSNRFGTTQQSVAKDAVIAQQANTAAVTAGAAPPTSPTEPLKTSVMNVTADTANVTEKP